jgi:hypothetical protein
MSTFRSQEHNNMTARKCCTSGRNWYEYLIDESFKHISYLQLGEFKFLKYFETNLRKYFQGFIAAGGQKSRKCWTVKFLKRNICWQMYMGPPLWCNGESSWLEFQRSQVRFPVLLHLVTSGGYLTGSTQLREDNWRATWMKTSGSRLWDRG